MKNSVKFLSVLFAIVILFSSFTFPTSARSLEDIEAEIAKNEKELDRLANEKNKKEDYIEALEEQNKALDAQIAEIERQAAPTIAKIQELDEEIKMLESEVARSNKMLSNPGFLAKAPEAKVNLEKEKLQKYLDRLNACLAKKASLK